MSSVQCIDTIRIDLTNTCNARCSFCPFHGTSGEVTNLLHDRREKVSSLMLSDFERITEELVDENQFPQFKFSGRGEATTHPDFGKIVSLLSRKGMPTRLITNGLCLEKFTDLLCESRTTTLVSLHGPEKVHDCAMGVNGAHKKASQAILAIKSKGGKVSIATVITPKVLPYLSAFIQRWGELGVMVRLQHDYSAWRRDDFPFFELKKILSQINNRGNLVVLPNLEGELLANYYTGNTRMVIDPRLCKRVGREIDLRSDGTVYACRSMPFGNIRDSNIIAIILGICRKNFLEQIEKETRTPGGLDSNLCDRCCYQSPHR